MKYQQNGIGAEGYTCRAEVYLNGIDRCRCAECDLSVAYGAEKSDFAQNAIFSSIYSRSPAIGMRTCSIVSRSRTVTQPSSTESKS